MSFEKDNDKNLGEVHEEYVERRKSTSEEVTELSGIEATAASKAAWLISFTVSIGGFLFGYVQVPSTAQSPLTSL